jgi:hypothetical protein
VLRPLAELGPLTAGIVFALLRWPFWVRRWIRHDGLEEFAKRMAALIGLHALAGLKSTAIAALLLDECDPEGRTIVVRMLGMETKLPVSAPLAHLLRQWMDARPASPSPQLFVTRDGAIHRTTVMALLRVAGVTLGVARPAEALNRFFFLELSRTADQEAYRSYRAAVKGLPHRGAAFGRLRTMIDGTDPFAGQLRRFVDEAAGREAALAEAPMLPLQYDRCIPAYKISQPHPWLPPSHPLVAALAGAEWPEDFTGRVALRKALLAKHRTEIDALIDAGTMPVPQVAALLKVRKAGVIKWRRAARRAADPSAVSTPLGFWRGAVPLASEEAARLAGIAALKWPVGVKSAKFREVVLKREFAFVAGLIEARKYKVGDAAKLFRIAPWKVREFRADLAAGVFDSGAPKCVPRAEREYWRGVIREQFARWPRHLGPAAFWRMLRREYGFRGDLKFVWSARREPAPKVPASPQTLPAPTATEAQRLASITSIKWPRGADAAGAFRRKLLEEHFGFVFGLLDRKVVTVRQAAKVFRIPHNLMTEMRSDYRAGTFDHVLQPPPTPAERRKWLALVRRELPLRSDTETPADFCRRLRQTYDFPLHFSVVNNLLARERKKDPHGPAKPTAKQGFLRVALSAAERKRLRVIRLADWDSSDEPDRLRRELLAAHLPFVCGLISGWKIRIVEAAELFHLAEATMGKVRKRFLSGSAPVRAAA